MHELSIAAQLVEQILAAAEQNSATAVTAVELHVGALEQVVSESLELAFEAVTEGTLAEGATLSIVEIPPEAVCGACGVRYGPDPGHYACPVCGRAEAEIVSGKGIVLQTLACTTEEGTGHDNS